jgi:hypothetical protein
MKYTDGRVHHLEYVIEGDHHLEDRYRRLVEKCVGQVLWRRIAVLSIFICG